MIYESQYYNQNYLAHHGVKGMKWGVRRYQNPDGTLTAEGKKHYIRVRDGGYTRVKKNDSALNQPHYLKKNTKMYRTSYSSNETEEGDTYVSYQKNDRHFYKYWVASRAQDQKAYETVYKAKKDILISSLDDQAEAFSKVFKNMKLDEKTLNDVLVDRQLDQYFGSKKKADESKKVADKVNAKMKTFKPIETIKQNENNPDMVDIVYTPIGKTKPVTVKNAFTFQDIDTAASYNTARRNADNVVKAFSDISDDKTRMIAKAGGILENRPDIRKAVVSELSKKGYDAMPDLAGIGSIPKNSEYRNREGAEPLIIFDRSNSMNKKKTRTLSPRMAYEEYRNKGLGKLPELKNIIQ